MQAKKSLGQNFLQEDAIIQKIVSLFNVDENDLIIEIGPGRGALTRYLSKLSCKVLCVEIDKDLKSILKTYETNNLKIIYKDILKINLNDIISDYNVNNIYVVGNLPYYITSPIITYLINSKINFKRMVFMVQDEVAKRFSANPGNRDYGYMTAYINDFYDVSYEFFVSRKFFLPIPKVDSAVITLNKKNTDIMPETYYTFLRECFKLKRKTLKNNLSNYNWQIVSKILIDNGYDINVRAEQVDSNTLKKIYNNLF